MKGWSREQIGKGGRDEEELRRNGISMEKGNEFGVQRNIKVWCLGSGSI